MKFGKFAVTDQVFYQSTRSFGIVNLRPLVPGHVLVCPIRCVARFSELSTEEVADLFLSVYSVSKAVERFYGAHALNIAIQDGKHAGQSIPHVHCHIIPRHENDLPSVDAVYDLMDKNDLSDAQAAKELRKGPLNPDPENRKDRPMEEMIAEAKTLRHYMATNTDPRI